MAILTHYIIKEVVKFTISDLIPKFLEIAATTHLFLWWRNRTPHIPGGDVARVICRVTDRTEKIWHRTETIAETHSHS